MMAVAAFALVTGNVQAYVPQPGSPERDAICNTVRLALANSQQGALQRDALHGARFIIDLIDIEGTDATFVGHGENGAYLGLRIRAYLRYGSNGWYVLTMD
jgi:hypothetical protein